MRRDGGGVGLAELMAAVAVAAGTLAVLRASPYLGLLILPFLPIVAARAWAAVRAERAAGGPATAWRVARAWGVSAGVVAGAYAAAGLLTVFLGSLVAGAIGLARAVARAGPETALGRSPLLLLVLFLSGLGLVGFLVSRLLQATWPRAGPPAAGDARAKLGDVDREGTPRAGRAGPAPAGVPPVDDEGDAAS
jgi:hypothetical protein